MSTRKGKKITGGKYIARRKKKSYEGQGQKRVVKLGEPKRKIKRTVGGNKKIFLLKIDSVNIIEPGKNKTIKAKIQNVIETPSNRFLARQNIITKGTIIETDKGKIRITNRPSQEGVLNGIILKEE